MFNRNRCSRKIEEAPFPLILFSAIMMISVVAPLFCMLLISFKEKNSYITNPYGIVGVHWTIRNYISMFTDFHVMRKIANSVVVSLGTASLVCLIAIPTAYEMLYINPKIRNITQIIMLAFVFMPTQLTLIVKYQLFLKLGLIDKFLSVVLSGTADWLPTCILLLTIYFQNIDADIFFAARLDGCNDFNIIFKILIPISSPAITVVFINTFTGMWNSFLEPMLFLRSEHMKLLMNSLAGLVERYRNNIPFQMAGYVLGMIPTLLLYTIFKSNILARK